MVYRAGYKYLVAAMLLTPLAGLAGDSATVEVGHGSIQPASVTISAGDEVVFRNVKQMPGGHTVVFEEIDAQSAGMAQGETWSHRFGKAGTYHFRIKEHPDNTGEVIVK